MGNCCSCCCQPRRPAYLVSVSPKKSVPEGTTVNPLQPDGKNLTEVDGLGAPLVPIWAQQILPSPRFMKEESPLVEDEPQRDAPAVIVIEEPLEASTPIESEEEEDDFDFDLPELVGPAGDQILETKDMKMTLAPTKVEIIEIERELANTPLPPGSDDEDDEQGTQVGGMGEEQQRATTPPEEQMEGSGAEKTEEAKPVDE